MFALLKGDFKRRYSVAPENQECDDRAQSDSENYIEINSDEESISEVRDSTKILDNLPLTRLVRSSG